jgi:hypothetical protein
VVAPIVSGSIFPCGTFTRDLGWRKRGKHNVLAINPMNSEARQYVNQFGVPFANWTIEDSDYGASIHVVLSGGRSMECHIECDKLHAAVVALLIAKGAIRKRLEDPRRSPPPDSPPSAPRG